MKKRLSAGEQLNYCYKYAEFVHLITFVVCAGGPPPFGVPFEAVSGLSSPGLETAASKR